MASELQQPTSNSKYQKRCFSSKRQTGLHLPFIYRFCSSAITEQRKMELQFSSSFPFLFCVLIFTILMVVKMGKRIKSNPNLPPGPWKLPFIGNMHQMIGSLPHHKLRDLAQKYGPLMHIQLGEVSLVVVSSAEMAKEVMKKKDIKFADRSLLLAAEIVAYGGTNIAFSPYGEYWRQLRKICTLELLSARRVQSFRSVREEELLNLIDWISSNGGLPVNLSEKLLSLGYANTSRAAFGKKTKDQERFNCATKEIIKLSAGFNIGDVFPSRKWLHVITGIKPKLERLHRETDRILSDIIEDHLQKRRNKVVSDDEASEDLVDVLLKFMENNELGFTLTLDNIKAVIIDMFIAGSETTATTVGWAMAEMMKKPSILHKAQSEVRQKFNERGRVEEDGLPQLQYLQLVIKETLRLHPPLVLLLPRECREQCEVGGFEIPLKTRVIVNAWAIGRDPKYWKEAENFDPERFLDTVVDYNGNHFDYIPFGAGRRMCPGVVFGLTNAEYQLATLLYHFDWKLPNSGTNSQELDMTEGFGTTVAIKNDLYLIPTPYQPPSSF